MGSLLPCWYEKPVRVDFFVIVIIACQYLKMESEDCIVIAAPVRVDFFEHMYNESRYLKMESEDCIVIAAPVREDFSECIERRYLKMESEDCIVIAAPVRVDFFEHMYNESRRLKMESEDCIVIAAPVQHVCIIMVCWYLKMESEDCIVIAAPVQDDFFEHMFIARREMQLNAEDPWSKTDGFKITANPDPWQNAKKKAFQQPGKDPSDGGHGFPERAQRWYPDLHDGAELLGICAIAA